MPKEALDDKEILIAEESLVLWELRAQLGCTENSLGKETLVSDAIVIECSDQSIHIL